MQQLQLCGQTVPAIGIGTWHMGSHPNQYASDLKAIRTGLDLGAKVVDTAEMYGNGDSETLVGEALAPYRREDLFLISKVLPSNASKMHLGQSLHASLNRLKTDYLDLYLYHWRGAEPLAETVGILQHFQDEGLIRHWGVSNFDISDMQELWQLPDGQNVAVNEDLYNLGSRGIEYSLLPWQKKHDIPLIAYSPVGAGGDYNGLEMSQNPAVQKVAQRHAATVWQVLLAWAIRDGHTLAIPKASRSAHMIDNIQAGNLTLTPEDFTELDRAYPAPTRKQSLDML